MKPDIRVNPCDRSWGSLTPVDGRSPDHTRRCEGCGRTIENLSALSTDEQRARLDAATTGERCAFFAIEPTRTGPRGEVIAGHVRATGGTLPRLTFTVAMAAGAALAIVATKPPEPSPEARTAAAPAASDLPPTDPATDAPALTGFDPFGPVMPVLGGVY